MNWLRRLLEGPEARSCLDAMREQDRRRAEDPYRYKIVETKWHSGHTHIDLHIQPPGLDWRSATDDYGYKSIDDAKAALEFHKKLALGEIKRCVKTESHYEEVPQPGRV